MGLALRLGGRWAEARVPKAAKRSSRLKISWLARIWARRPEPRVLFGPPLLPGLETLAEGEHEWLDGQLARARALRAGEFRYHGRTVVMPNGVDWFPSGVPDPWIEAHHRLEALLPIGLAYVLARDTEEQHDWYDLAAGIVRDWMTDVRPAAATAWERPVLTARIVNLMHFHEVFAAALREDDRFRGTFLRNLYDQVQYLDDDLEGAASEPSLIAAGRALATAGRFFDGLEAREWLDKGGGILWQQLQRTVNEDGGNAWRSPSWQCFVLEQYVHALALLRGHGEDLPAWARKRVKAMCDFLVRVTRPDGVAARLGDRAPSNGWTPTELVGMAGTLLAEPGVAPHGELTGLWPTLMLGPDGRRAHAALPRRVGRIESRALRRTGYYVLAGADGDSLILDGGPARNGQAPFGYELSVGGLPLLVAGGGTDVGAGKLESYFAGPRSQNLLVNGRHSPATAPVEAHWMMRSGLASFVGMAGPLRRIVLCLPGRFWLVCDHLTGPGVWTGQSLIHVHPETEVRSISRGRPTIQLTRSRAARGTLVFAGSHDVRLVHGLDGARPQGWYADEGALPVPAPTVSLTVGGPLPLVCGYAFVPRTDSNVALSIEHDAFRLNVALRIGRNEYQLTMQQGEIELRTVIV